MNIFENLENLNVSEKCFNDIMMIIEGVLNEEDLDKESEEVEKKLADSIQRIKDKKIGLDLKRRKLQINREKLENIFGNKEATEQAASDHADAQIKKGLSESCFNDIIRVIEKNIYEFKEDKKFKKEIEKVKKSNAYLRKKFYNVNNEKCKEQSEVSEECFNDIIGIVEDMLSYAQKKAKEASDANSNFYNTHKKYVDKVLHRDWSQKDNKPRYKDKVKGKKFENIIKTSQALSDKSTKAKKLLKKVEDFTAEIKKENENKHNHPIGDETGVPKNVKVWGNTRSTKNDAGEAKHQNRNKLLDK